MIDYFGNKIINNFSEIFLKIILEINLSVKFVCFFTKP